MGGASPQRSAIATVMFTDAESSTALTTLVGDEAAERLFAGHDRIVRDRIVAHGGRSVERTGDGFLALFDSARGAVTCALEIQSELSAQPDGIRVRIGLNAGEVMEGDGQLFGAAINLAKRVMDRASGGEILVTETVRQLAGTVPDARFRDRGRTALKGFAERRHLYAVETTAPRPQPPRGPPRRRPRRAALAAGALVLVAVGLGAAIIASGGEDPITVASNTVAIIDAEEGRVVGQVPVGIRPTDVAVGAGSVWVANAEDGTVSKISPRSRRVTGNIAPGSGVAGLAVSPRALWVAGSQNADLRAIDPEFRTVSKSRRLDDYGTRILEPTRALGATAEAVWVTSGIATLARLDPRSGRTVARVPVGNAPKALAIGAGALWVSDDEDGTVTRIDPETNAPAAPIAVGESASGLAVAEGGVWVAVPHEDRVKRIDTATNAVADTVRVGGGPAAVAAGAGAVWVTSRRGGTVTRIDPATARVTRTVDVGHSPQGVAVVGGEVWVAVQDGPAPAGRAGGAPDVLRVLDPRGFLGGTDPALAGANATVYATCAALLNYPDEPFPAGAQIRPEVARDMPAVSDGGRTYTFRLRPGFRFSPPSNAPVTADAFRRAIERALHPKTQSYASVVMSDIVGVEAFQDGRAKQLAGVTARADTLTIRLKRPSPTFVARIGTPYFCAVPPETPISAAALEEIPSAGPYYVASFVPERRLVLRRNPNYRGDRPARMREMEIDLDVGRSPARAAVLAGRADYVTTISVDATAALDRRYGPRSPAARVGAQRYFSGPLPALHWFALNTRRPLFADRRMRIAVNAALDRPALARTVHAGVSAAPGRATDQFIPPGQPGFRDVAIYPLGGDLARARRLAGGRRRRAVLITCDFPHCREHGEILRRNLAAIGIAVEVENVPLSEMFTRLQTTGEPWDIGYYNYFHDYVDPGQFIVTLFDPPEPEQHVGGFRDPGILRRIRATARLDEAARVEAFAQLDADLARAGAAAPFGTSVSTDLFSERIGCQVHQPTYGISLGALCLRE